MNDAPRLEIDLDKIEQNARELVHRFAQRGISVTGVTKAALGSIEIAHTLLKAGVIGLGDSRIENIKAMYSQAQGTSFQNASMTLIRSPMLSQVEQVIRYATVSCNTELKVIQALSAEAQKQGRLHQVVLMVELGDLREGIMPDDLVDFVREVLLLTNITLKGIGTNLACRSGVSPDAHNMAQLSELADLIETKFQINLEMISGGNSANIQWALNDPSTDIGRINNLRLGEALLLGCEPLYRQPIRGLHTDAITLVAEVIESKQKPSKPTGVIAQAAFGETAVDSIDRGSVKQAILAIGAQDIDPNGLKLPSGLVLLGASSDHLVIESLQQPLVVGEEVVLQLNYSAMVRAMTSPFVTKIFSHSHSHSHSC